MQMEPQLMSLPSLSFPLLCSLPSLACFFSSGRFSLLLFLHTLCRCGNVSKLSTVKGLSSSHSLVVDPLLGVQREISVVLVIVVKFFLAARFLCVACCCKVLFECWWGGCPGPEVLLGWQWWLLRKQVCWTKPISTELEEQTLACFRREGAALTHCAWEPGIQNSVFMTSSFGACCQRGFHLC